MEIALEITCPDTLEKCLEQKPGNTRYQFKDLHFGLFPNPVDRFDLNLFQAAFGRNLRQLISSRRMLRKIVDFGSSQVFETVTTYTCLLFLSNYNEVFEFAELKPSTTAGDLPSVFDFIDANSQGETDKVAIAALSNERVSEKEWHLSAGRADKVLVKLHKQPRRLSDGTWREY